jgi:hypothetical protein
MKKNATYSVVFILITALLGISSCSKAPLVIKYDLGELNITLPGQVYQGYQVYTFPISHTDVQSFISSVGKTTDLSRVSSSIVKGLTANVTTTGSDFSQISSVEVYLKPASNTTSVGDQVAYSEPFASGVTQSVLKANGTDMRQLLSNDMVLTVKVLNSTGGNNPINLKLNQGYIEISVRQ